MGSGRKVGDRPMKRPSKKDDTIHTIFRRIPKTNTRFVQISKENPVKTGEKRFQGERLIPGDALNCGEKAWRAAFPSKGDGWIELKIFSFIWPSIAVITKMHPLFSG